MRIILVLTCIAFLHVVGGFKTLKPLSHMKLPTSLSSRGEELFIGINHGAAEAAAYDHLNSIVYVIGRSGRLMHVIDIQDPAHPSRLFRHKFAVAEGFPQAIAICGGEIAVALSAQPDTNNGQVRFFHTYSRNSKATDVALVGNMTVGPHPKHLRYTDDCDTVVVSNEGIAGKDSAGNYVNPEGSITIIHREKTANRSARMVDFHSYNIGQPNFNMQIRVPSLYIPKSFYNGDTTVAQDIEPEHVTISGDGSRAWVTIRENNAIVEMSLSSSTITRITPLPKKVWNALPIDVSDRDGGIHRRTYAGLQSLRQPGAIARMIAGNKEFLVTADAGGVKRYTAIQHGFVWTDYAYGSAIANKIEGDALKANASNNELLGRIMVSTVDGKNPYTGMHSHFEMFGGRGFSIWDTSNIQAPVFDTEGTLEEYMESFYREVFNTEHVTETSNYSSPEMNRDFSSKFQGAYVSSIDVQDDNGTVYLVAGTWSTGTLFLYTVDTSSGQPIPQFQAIHRAGTSDLPWDDLYTQDTIGDLHISTVGIIPSTKSPDNRTLLFVAASGSGSLSLYEIADDVPVITP